MLQWRRARTRPIAGLALAALVTVTLESVVPHDAACHAAACEFVSAHDPLGHAVSDERGAPEFDVHCVLCHWTRSVRPPAETPRFVSPTAECRGGTQSPVVARRQRLASEQPPPLRAPSAFPHHA
jgi:hypothetical protein